MIVKTLNLDDFINEFERMGRGDQFSQTGLSLLFSFLNEISEEICEPLELDVIAICCEYVEYSLDEIIVEWGLDSDYFDDVLDRDIIDEVESLTGCTVIIGDIDNDVLILHQ